MTKVPENFYLTNHRNEQQSQACVDFTFRIPIKSPRAANAEKAADQTQHLVPSVSFVGSTWYTQSSTLHDQHQLHGRLDVKYWIEAEFYRSGQIIFNFERPTKFSFTSTGVGLGVTPRTTETSRLIARSPLFKRRPFGPDSRLIVDLFASSTAIVPVETKINGLPKRVILPITATLEVPFGQTTSLSDLRCVVDAQWRTTTTFSTVPSYAREGARKATTQITQRLFNPLSELEIQFPPFYQASLLGSGSTRTYRTTSTLEVPIPDNLALGSINTALLSREYTLDAKFDFFDLGGSKRFKAEGNISVNIHPMLGDRKATQFLFNPAADALPNDAKTQLISQQYESTSRHRNADLST